LPIFENEDGMTPIDLSLKEGLSMNTNFAAVMFKNIKSYPMLHSAHLL